MISTISRHSILNWFWLGVILLFLSCKTDVTTQKLSVNENAKERISKDVLHIRLKKDPRKLNPILKASPAAKLVFQYIMPQVCDYNPYSLAAEPVLLSSLPEVTLIEDGKYKGLSNIRMEIKPSAAWDNGSPITSEDYIFTVKLAKHPEVQNTTWRVALEMIKDVHKDPSDPKIINVIVDSDYYLSVDWVSSIQLFPKYIYDPDNISDRITISELNDISTVDNKVHGDSLLVHWAKSFNSSRYFKDIVVGCGPYRLVEWESDQYIRLVKKSNYWAVGDSNSYLLQGPEEILFHIIPDEINAISQLKSGKLDVLSHISPTSFDRLKKDNNLRAYFNFFTPRSMKHYILGLNNRATLLQDVNVRKGLAHAIDVQAIIETVEYNMARRITGDFSPQKEIYNSRLSPRSYDIPTAIVFLRKSGWEDTDNDGIMDKNHNGVTTPLRIEYLCSKDAKARQIATLVKQQALKAGIDIEIITKEFRDIHKKHLKTHDFDMTMLSVTQAVPPDDPYARWHSDNIGIGKSNYFQFSDPKADEIIEEIRITKDKVKSKKLYFELQKIMQDQQVIIPLYELDAMIIISNSYNAKCFTKRPNFLVNTFMSNL